MQTIKFLATALGLCLLAEAAFAPAIPAKDVVVLQNERLQHDEATIAGLKNRVERLEKLMLYMQQHQTAK